MVRKLSVISFTTGGERLSKELAKKAAQNRMQDCPQEAMPGLGKIEISLFTKYTGDEETPDHIEYTCSVKKKGGQYVKYVETSVLEWAGEQMRQKNALLFIGACGIAVRAIAPFLTDKLKDPPVLVMDEKGKYVIPILSGHMGGANELALFLAGVTGAEPVITTATDVNGRFAVDLFAKKNGLFILNKEGIAKVSAKVLAGREITFSIEAGHEKQGMDLPEGIRRIPYPPKEAVDILVSSKAENMHAEIFLKPREYVIGVGCKKGKEAACIEEFITEKLEEYDICTEQLLAIASVSCKKEEEGLLAFGRKTGIPFLTYTAEELGAVEGEFQGSSFVLKQVGVDNVCERAAIKACGESGSLVCRKCAKEGMTIAIAKREWSVGFEET